ncbi:hypothetical protein PO124_24365 [Bacillus licheniformis]|nr:hypothetical protein [Bacillus licheniformis]
MAGTPDADEVEPMYGPLYLPRKFKSASPFRRQMISMYFSGSWFIAIVEDDKLIGFNVAIGGGMGMTHGDKATYPQLAKVIGFCKPEQLYDVAEKRLRSSGTTETVRSAKCPLQVYG